MTSYKFIIDTDQYSGNFERQMCAYITTLVGDCGVGEDIADEALEAASEEDHRMFKRLDWLVVSEPDEHGCSRPCSIWATPEYGNNGNGVHARLTVENAHKFKYPAYQSVAIHLASEPEVDMLRFMSDRAVAYANKYGASPFRRTGLEPLNVLHCRLIEVKTVCTERLVWRLE